MEFRILGPLEVLDQGERLPLPRLKERTVLAVLLLHANEFVSRERLIDELWGDEPPPTASKAVSVYVSQLRKTLTRNGADPIATAEGGYRLDLAPEQLDAARMHELLAIARECVSKGELNNAAERFRDALSLWRGPTLAGLQLESFGRDEVAQLDELRIAALMDRIDCDLALGRHEQVLGELNVLVREHPLRERLRAQQMLALYRADRQAEALDAYAEARRTLVDGLGIEPSPALQRLQQAILRHDPSLETPTGIASVNGPVAPELQGSVGGAPPDDSVLEAPRAARQGRRRARVRPRRRAAAVAVVAAVVVTAVAIASIAATHTGGSGLKTLQQDSVGLIDPQTGRLVAQLPVGAGPDALAAAKGVLWVANGDGQTVTRIDMHSHKTTATIPVGGHPSAIVADARGAWVGELADRRLVRIDAAFDRVVRAVQVGPTALALAGGYLWDAVNGTTLERRDAATGKLDDRRVLDLGVQSLAGDGLTLWVGGRSSFMTPFDALRGIAVGRPVPVLGEPEALTAAGRDLWALTWPGALQEMDVRTMSVIATVPAAGSVPPHTSSTQLIAATPKVALLANPTSGSLLRVDAANTQVRGTVRIGATPRALLASPSGIWVAAS